MKRTIEKVFYPPVGIAHILDDLIDLIKYRIDGKSKIIINTSSQPNGIPHLGTMMSFACVFAFAEHIRNKLHICTEVLFDELENCPGKKKYTDKAVICTSLCDVYENDISMAESYMKFFREILNDFSKKSSIPYSVRTYSQFQRETMFREGLIKILDNYSFFSQLLNPSSNRLHLRIKCPVCNEYDKTSKNLNIQKQKEGGYLLESYCEKHGYYSVNLTIDNDEYVDVNTQLRDLLKGYMINHDQKNIVIMMDGSDWGGTWSNRIHCEGLLALGENVLPIRIFTPMILDWSGAKFSKSLYMKLNDYEGINQAFNDFREFKEKYSSHGMDLIWELACQWVVEPKKFFRNYSIDYFDLIFRSLEESKYE